MSSHTKGPWKVDPVQGWGVRTPTEDIIRCYGKDGYDNAALCAAAPDLFEWLKAIVSQADAQYQRGDKICTISRPMIEAMRQDVAKAEGREREAQT